MDIVPIKRIKGPYDAFHCEPYKVNLLARACQMRQVVANDSSDTRRKQFASCQNCVFGKEVAERIKGASTERPARMMVKAPDTGPPKQKPERIKKSRTAKAPGAIETMDAPGEASIPPTDNALVDVHEVLVVPVVGQVAGPPADNHEPGSAEQNESQTRVSADPNATQTRVEAVAKTRVDERLKTRSLLRKGAQDSITNLLNRPNGKPRPRQKTKETNMSEYITKKCTNCPNHVGNVMANTKPGYEKLCPPCRQKKRNDEFAQRKKEMRRQSTVSESPSLVGLSGLKEAGDLIQRCIRVVEQMGGIERAEKIAAAMGVTD